MKCCSSGPLCVRVSTDVRGQRTETEEPAAWWFFFDVVLTSLVTVGVALLCISPLVSIAGYFETKQRIRRLHRDATEGVDLVHKELA